MNTDDRTISLWEDEEDSAKKIILINQKTQEKFSFILEDSFVVGRLKNFCDLQITRTDQYISKRHVCFRREGNKVYAEDLHTINGTSLNGKKISGRAMLRPGDLLKIGQSEFYVIIQ